jgi:ParB family chromosome partitioning protein
MPAKKQALGRGLDSLIGSVTDIGALSSPPPTAQVVEIAVSNIRPSPHQPRLQFPEEQIAELASSIREKGILQPLLVRRRADVHELIAGERRLRAARSLEMKTVPCLVLQVSDEESLEMAMIENLQREDLNPLEEARAYQCLTDRFALTQEEVARRVGKARATVANSLRLLNLPLDIQEDILENRLTAGHARAILSVSEPAKQRQLRNVILARGLSVRQAESQARLMTREKKPRPPRPQIVEAEMRSLQEELSMKIGLPVFIKAVTEQSGKLEIHYHSLDDFVVISDFFGIERR